MYNSNNVQKRNILHYTQQIFEFALIRYLIENRAHPFKLEFNSNFNTLTFPIWRTFAGVFNVPTCNSKLCRPGAQIPFQSSVKDFESLVRLVALFTLQGYCVMDPYKIPITATIDCIYSDCITLEPEPGCFDRALNLLCSFHPSVRKCCIPKHISPQRHQQLETECKINHVHHRSEDATWITRMKRTLFHSKRRAWFRINTVKSMNATDFSKTQMISNCPNRLP